MTSSDAAKSELPLHVLLRRVVALTSVCGFVEVIGYMDIGKLYPAIMTGNTVQLGWSIEGGDWVRVATIGMVIGAFFLACMVASLLKRRLPHPPAALFLTVVLLVLIAIVREYESLRLTVELPLLALALAIQGQVASKFGGVSLQTIVVTNNIVKFCDSFVGRYVSSDSSDPEKRPPLKEVLLPGSAWLTYTLSAALGALAYHMNFVHFLLPISMLVLVALDMLALPDH